MKWTLKKAAREWGLDDETLKRRMVAAGHEVKRGAQFTTREISDAINGSLERERIRTARRENDEAEAAAAERAGTTMRREDVLALISSKHGQVRRVVESWPAKLSAQCNPAEPALARVVLQAAVDGLWKEVGT